MKKVVIVCVIVVIAILCLGTNTGGSLSLLRSKIGSRVEVTLHPPVLSIGGKLIAVDDCGILIDDKRVSDTDRSRLEPVQYYVPLNSINSVTVVITQ